MGSNECGASFDSCEEMTGVSLACRILTSHFPDNMFQSSAMESQTCWRITLGSRISPYRLPSSAVTTTNSVIWSTSSRFFIASNSGGAKLNNQEIRNCIYSGTLNNFLRELDQDEKWLIINGRSLEREDRYRGQEQILRFFAFHDNYHAYRGSLTAFLNRYMKEHREPSDDFLNDKRAIFRRTINLVSDSIFGGDPDDRIGISLLEATMVGVSLSLDYLEHLPMRQIRQIYDELLVSEEFSEYRLREGLSGTRRTLERMSVAERMFSAQGYGLVRRLLPETCAN